MRRSIGSFRFIVTALLALSCFSSFAFGEAKAITLHFIVAEKGNGNPLSKAEIRIKSNSNYTDDKGIFTLKNLVARSGQIVISRRGYETERLDLAEIKKSQTLRIFLYPDGSDDADIIIQGKKKDSASEKTISAAEAGAIARKRSAKGL